MKGRDTRPCVSVIIATSNDAEYVGECLDSVLSQSLDDIEVIVIDVMSKDETKEIMADSERRDNRVISLSDSLGSIGHAKNLGIDRASASYIMIVEPYDCLKDDALKLLYNKMEEEPEYELVKGLMEGFDDETEPLPITAGEGARRGDGKDCVMARWMMFRCAGIYRSSFLRNKHIRHYDRPGCGRQSMAFDSLGFVYANTLTMSDAVYMKRTDVKQKVVTDPKSVFDACAEFRFIEDRIRKSPDKWKLYKYTLWQTYFQSNLEMYEILSANHRPKLSARMHDEIKSAIRVGDFGRDYFDEVTRDSLELLLDSPKKFDEEWKKRDWNYQIHRAQIQVKLDEEDTARREAEPESEIERISREMEENARKRRIDRGWLTDEMVRDLVPLRTLLGVSADEMGEILGVSKTIYKSMEAGKRKMSWNQYLTLLFMFHFNSRTWFVVDGLGLYPKTLKERIASGNDRTWYE
ncbi:MAG: glycosyltransferase family 2 protein [Lachnospiraceae bacterium]|nr:glycosyltransferase family 2 protein [Lachnospiraceae bacterium]